MTKFRVVEGGLGTLQEIETFWSFTDLFNAVEYLDIRDESERYFSERAMKKKG